MRKKIVRRGCALLFCAEVECRLLDDVFLILVNVSHLVLIFHYFEHVLHKCGYPCLYGRVWESDLVRFDFCYVFLLLLVRLVVCRQWLCWLCMPRSYGVVTLLHQHCFGPGLALGPYGLVTRTRTRSRTKTGVDVCFI